MERIVNPVILAYVNIYTTKTTHKRMMDAICDCVNFFRAIIPIRWLREVWMKYRKPPDLRP